MADDIHHLHCLSILVGKFFGCVDINIEYKNISISPNIRGNIVYQIEQ